MSQPSTQIRCSALLFDMDGVLINSIPAVARVWRRWALEHGLNPEEVVPRAQGRPSITTIREYLPNSDFEAENHEVERREMEDVEGIVPLPGARELLASLPVNRWTIVTSATRPLAEVRLHAARLPIPQRLISATDVIRGKPHPEPYLKAAEILGFPAPECIVVEDVPAGIQSGKAAGARVIAFTTTFPASKLRQTGADWTVQNCKDISLLDCNEHLRIAIKQTSDRR